MAEAVAYLRNFYSTGIDPCRNEEFPPIEEISSNQDIQELSKALKFDKENAIVIAKLLISGEKPLFTRFVCQQDNVCIDLNNVIIAEKRLLEHLLYETSDYIFEPSSALLFRTGYQLCEEDRKILAQMFDKNSANFTEQERNHISRWCTVMCLGSIWYREDALNVQKLSLLLRAIMSLKYDMPIGYKFQNLRQLSINFLEFHKEFGHIYIQAMKAFGQYEKQLEEDKKGTLLNKLNLFQRNAPNRNRNYNGLISQIFPELLGTLN